MEALTEELRDLCEQIDNLKEDVLELTAPLNDTQFTWHPGGSRWSISECLAHLNVVDRLDVPLLAEAIAQGRAAGLTGSGPFHYGWLSRRFVRYQDGPVKIKMKAPGSTGRRPESLRKRSSPSSFRFMTRCGN